VKGETIDKVVKSVAEQVKRPDDILRMLQGETDAKPTKQTKIKTENVLAYLRKSIVEYIPTDEKKPQHLVVKQKEGVYADTIGFDPDKPGENEKAPPAVVYEHPRLPVDKSWIDYAAMHDLSTNSFAMIGGTSAFELTVKKDLGNSDYLFLLN